MSGLRAPSVVSRRWQIRVHALQLDGSAVAGLTILFVWLAIAAFAPLLFRGDPNAQELADALLPPAWLDGGSVSHLLGTDQLGRDILLRVVYGARSSIEIGLVAVVGSAALGSLIGVTAAQGGPVLDETLMRLADIQLSIPFFLLAVAALAMLGGTAVNMIGVLIVSGWVNYARVVRSELLFVRHTEFVLAAKAIGARSWRIAWRYLLPSTRSLIIVTATLQLADVVLLSAALSFLGIGLQPPAVSWGAMLSDGRDYLTTAWWISTIPGAAITLLILSVNLTGDWMSDFMNPLIRTGR
jgi:peptide/nickel transport system permease protein